MTLTEKINLRVRVLRDDIRRKNVEIEVLFKDKTVPKEMIEKVIVERNDMILERESREAAFDALQAVGR